MTATVPPATAVAASPDTAPDSTSSTASDRALARRSGLGDAEAFSELFHRHFHATLRYAVHMLGNDSGLAEEAAQEAWIKVWRHLPGFRGESAVLTWIFTIVARQVLDLRTRRRPVPVDDSLLEPLRDHAPGPDSEAAHEQLWTALGLALGELPWRQRASWVLRELDQMSYEEIAQVLDTTPTVVRGQLHRARRALAVRMEQWR